MIVTTLSTTLTIFLFVSVSTSPDPHYPLIPPSLHPLASGNPPLSPWPLKKFTPHAGDLLRAERASGSEDGELIQSHIVGGTIVPVAITVKLLANAMKKVPGGKFLIDGFPRNEDNVTGWEDQMKDKVGS